MGNCYECHGWDYIGSAFALELATFLYLFLSGTAIEHGATLFLCSLRSTKIPAFKLELVHTINILNAMLSIDQTIYNVCELSKLSKIPFLLVSNPGYKKTLGVKRYAEENGYHVECLIGSRSTPEELLGYQVNDGKSSHLKHLDSQWWSRIMDYEKKGVHSILFCDELSTCSPQVQGAMFSLIQDRMNNNGEKLPDTTIIVSAANYSSNLASYMDILSPTLNRFCIINIASGKNGLDIVNEIFNAEPVEKLTYKALSESQSKQYLELMKKLYDNIFIEYSDKSSSKGYIDVQATSFETIYQDAANGLYNFITLRTLWNLNEIFKLCIELSITDEDFIGMVANGLVGLGSNSFNEKQGEAYRKLLKRSLVSVESKVLNIKAAVEEERETPDDINGLASELLQSLQEVPLGDRKKLQSELARKIDEEYGEPLKKLKDMKSDKAVRSRFLSDYEILSEVITSYKADGTLNDALCKVLATYYWYYNELSGGETEQLVKSSLYSYCMVANVFGKAKLAGFVDDKAFLLDNVDQFIYGKPSKVTVGDGALVKL